MNHYHVTTALQGGRERGLQMEVRETLVSFVEDYLKSNCIPVHRITLPCNDYSWVDHGLRQAIQSSRGYRPMQHYFESIKPKTIYHLQDVFYCVYTTFRLPDSDELMVCGPVMFGNGESVEKNPLCSVRFLPALQNFYQQVAVFHQSTAYYNIFKHLGPRIYGDSQCKIVYDSPKNLEFLFDPYCENSEVLMDPASKFHAVEKWFSMEVELTIAVCKGSEDDILAAISKVQSSSLPPIIPDEVQNIRSCMTTLDTLLRKSVQMSGVPPVFIDPYTRLHVQKITQLTDKVGMDTLLTQLVRDYYLLLHQQAIKQYSLLTQKIITLIGQDVTANLRLNAISEKVNANAKYLSALFKREVGVTLTDYVTGQRMELAKQMLLYTDYPIKTIAKKCGIPDIHYFSLLFRKKTGCTPKFYRENHFPESDSQN